MGDTSDMILEGILCQRCGVYIDDNQEAGYPRDCSSCKPNKNRNMNRNFKDKKKSDKPTTGDNAIKGVKNFLRGKGLEEDDLQVITKRFYEDELDGKTTEIYSVEFTCDEIQKDFSKFVNWFKKLK